MELRFDYLNRFAGAAIPEHDVRRILADLGFAVESTEGGLRLEVPTNKVDVTRPVDVVEEVLRIYGYNRIPLPAKMSVSPPSIVGFDADSLQAAISAFLASNGFFELFTNSLTKEQYAERPSVKAEEAVRLLNPLSGDLGMLRLDMLPTGLEAIAWNRNRKQADVRFYEFGKSYHKLEGQYTERRHLALYLCGRKHEPAWNAPEAAAGFFTSRPWWSSCCSAAASTRPSGRSSRRTILSWRRDWRGRRGEDPRAFRHGEAQRGEAVRHPGRGGVCRYRLGPPAAASEEEAGEEHRALQVPARAA